MLYRYLLACALLCAAATASAGLADTVAKVKKSMVGVGTFAAVRAQQHQLRGTGFVVSGNHVITNSHVAPGKLKVDRRETLSIYVPRADGKARMLKAKVIQRDAAHDLALLRFEGGALPALRLGKDSNVREGESIALTGFPILNALGLFPATHRGIVAAISPIVIPVQNAKKLNPALMRKLRKPFKVFQLDATAYPGNSGSPVFEPDTGRVIGVVNSVYIKKTKELAIQAPSGISYAIPVSHVKALLRKAGVGF